MPNELPLNKVKATIRDTNLKIRQVSVPDLPEDIFVIILDELEAWDIIQCQKVSKAWKETFKSKEYLQFVLRKYLTAFEVRKLDPKALQLQSQASLLVNWSRIFQSVASRYHNLKHGKIRHVETYNIAALDQFGYWQPVGQWDYHESQPEGRLYDENAFPHLTRWSRNGTKPSLFRATLWSYDNGLLVYAPAISVDFDHRDEVFAVLDVETGKMSPIPFDISSKIIRTIRLKDRTLIIEWAERDPFHDLNDMEQVNRHFASCFDIHLDQNQSWTAVHRSEWKMHFLGLPLNQRDRFFSTHNAQHYAIYFWQPNRSMYTGDEELPIEALFVWDISQRSTYLPSEDPSGKHQPPISQRPHLIARFPFNELDFRGIRQHSNISLTSIHLDSASCSLTFRGNTCVAGQGYFDPAERLWCATTTTFPFLGLGPHLRRAWDGNLPPYRGHCTMESAPIDEPERWFLPVMDIVDEEAGVRLSLVETCFTGQTVENRMVIRVKIQEQQQKQDDDKNDQEVVAAAEQLLLNHVPGSGEWVTIGDDDIVREITAMGRIAGDERWVIGQNERMQIVVAMF